ncbi:hypothetical protein ONZ45_g5415 [Pleurotus djamor]|nr:hypothetical protein ONZ45_g5415 [Pleurotus djamor]
MVMPGQSSPASTSNNQRPEQGSPVNDEQPIASPIPLGSDLVLMTANQDIRSQIEILQRTVTLVFWYKSNTEPLRLQHPVPTFPLFQLSRFPSLTTDLGLTPTTYLDTYNRDSRQWEQHTITTVRVIDGHPRLLYRIRKSLLETLADDQCVGLSDEIDTQLKQRPISTVIQTVNAPQLSPTSPASSSSEMMIDDKVKARSPTLKRPAPSGGSDIEGPPNKLVVMDGYTRQQHQPYPAYLSAPSQSGTPASKPNNTAAPPEQASPTSPKLSESRAQSLSSPREPSVSSPTSPQQTPTVIRPGGSTYLYQSSTSNSQYNGNNNLTSPSSVSLPQYLVHPPAAAPLIPYHPHPPLKRWPNDYTVSELSAGFQAMEALVHQTPNGGAAMTQRMAFERVFGSRYVKSTVCRHRGVWRKAPQSLREEFEAMGEDERACWGEFVRRVEGRPPGRINGPPLIPVHELPYQMGAQKQQQQASGSKTQAHPAPPSGPSSAAPGSHHPNGHDGNYADEDDDENDDDDDDANTPQPMSAMSYNAVDDNMNNNTPSLAPTPEFASISAPRMAVGPGVA